MTFDVAIVGGGLVGAACADALAGEGLTVRLVEAGPFAREASWAGAGILHPIHPWNYPDALQPLLRAAPAAHLHAAPDLLERTGIDVELERSGLLVMGDSLGRLEDWCGRDVPQRRVRAEAEIPGPGAAGEGLLLPDALQVKNHRLARAFLEGARRRGARLDAWTRVEALSPGSIETTRGRIAAGQVVLCAGAWSAGLRPGLAIEPVRGQILLYRGTLPRMVVFPDGEYAVPRRGGRVLFGSTLERVGFDARPTEETYDRLAERAERLLGLRRKDLLAAWAGLRPGCDRGLPYIGRDPEREGLVHACGHYRNGILLAPLTARIVADVVLERPAPFDMAPFQANPS